VIEDILKNIGNNSSMDYNESVDIKANSIVKDYKPGLIFRPKRV
jgi:hypothetical protein